MAKLILHKEANVEAINERRFAENLAMSREERMRKAIELMKLSLLFQNDAIPPVA